MGCCGSTVIDPSGPPPSTSAPRGTQRTAPVPVPSQTSPEIYPVPSSQPVSRTRSRRRYGPQSTQHSGMSSQDPNVRIRMNSAPQPPQSSKSSSSHIHRTRTKSLAAHKRTNRSDCSPTSPSRAIQASIEYVVCLPTLSSFIPLVLRNGRRSREYIVLTDNPILTTCFSLGYWRNLWSNLDFADKPVKDCVNVIHIDIIKIWDLDDRNGVSSFIFPCFRSTESVSLR
jgi:hypothetical protein